MVIPIKGGGDCCRGRSGRCRQSRITSYSAAQRSFSEATLKKGQEGVSENWESTQLNTSRYYSCFPNLKIYQIWDFPGGPVVKTSPSNAGGAGSIPGRGAGILCASWPENQNVKQKQYCNKFNKELKNGPHQKKNLKKKFF